MCLCVQGDCREVSEGREEIKLQQGGKASVIKLIYSQKGVGIHGVEFN